LSGNPIDRLYSRRHSNSIGARIVRLLTPPRPLIEDPDEYRIDAPLGERNLYLGGAGASPEGYINLDLYPVPGVDVCADVQQLPFPDNCFHFVDCDAVLEHVQDARLALMEIERVLLPGGFAHVVVPFMHPFHEYPKDYRRFTPDGMRELAEGLEMVKEGWRTGPTATLLVTILEYVKIWLPRPLGIVAHGVLGWVLFPLRYLDIPLRKRPRYNRLGNHCYAWFRKPPLKLTNASDQIS
jgi:SAM-dependent methyltransferase